MSDYVVLDGDTADFQPTFGAAIVVVASGNITGMGSKLTVSGKAACIEGDESSVQVTNCTYTAGAYTVPGTGTLSVDSLNSDQKAQKLKIDGKPVILVGSNFNAKFTVTTPAQTSSSPPTSDTTTAYYGSGSFVTNNTLLTSD